MDSNVTKDICIKEKSFQDHLRRHQEWLFKGFPEGRKLDLQSCKLEGISIKNVDLRKAVLDGSNLSGTHFSTSNLRNASLYGTKLINSGFTRTDLGNVDLRITDLSSANFASSNLAGVIYEPIAGSLPYLPSLIDVKGLRDLKYKDSPHGLIELQHALKKAGLRKQEREVTYAVRRNLRIKDTNYVISVVQFLFFEFTCGWGLYPYRPIFIIIGLIFVFAIFYIFPLRTSRNTLGGIYKCWKEKRIDDIDEPNDPQLMTLSGRELIKCAFYFSTLSAFHIGWKDVNVGNWISRMQPHEFELKPTRWVRTVSGFQSLLSVILLALSILSYYGRPFE